MSARLSMAKWLILITTGCALLWYWRASINDSPVIADAAQNLQMSINLQRFGVVSLSEAPPYEPSMIREPLPIAGGAVAVSVVDALLGPAPAAEYFHGKRAELLKTQNMLWMAVLSVALFMIGQRVGLTFLSSLLCVLLTNALLLGDWFRLCMLNSLLTESAAAALLALGSLMLIVGVQARKWRWFALAGICFGLLALVKAIFLYIALGMVFAIPVLALWQRRPAGAAALQGIVMGVFAALVVLPWMQRNHSSIGQFDIAGRGGEALHDRAVMDQMTRDEYFGSFYAWAPYPFGGPLRRVLGYAKEDLNEGGRLQRLNELSTTSFAARDEAAELAGKPDETFTYYRHGRAERVVLVNQFTAEGKAQPWMLADRELKRRALHMVAEHPLRHAALTIPFMWRGGYFAFLPLLLTFIYAWRRRSDVLEMMVTPALALVVFYAMTASFEPRYAFPMHPMAMCSLVVLGEALVRRWRARSMSGVG